jgi:hypothetical protein
VGKFVIHALAQQTQTPTIPLNEDVYDIEFGSWVAGYEWRNWTLGQRRVNGIVPGRTAPQQGWGEFGVDSSLLMLRNGILSLEPWLCIQG